METLVTTEPWLRVQGLELGYSRRAVTPKALNFSLHQNQITAVLGKNGAGKTTLLRALLSEPVIRAGHIEFFGIPARRFEELAYLPQEPLYPIHLSLVNCLALAFVRELGPWGKTSPSATIRL